MLPPSLPACVPAWISITVLLCMSICAHAIKNSKVSELGLPVCRPVSMDGFESSHLTRSHKQPTTNQAEYLRVNFALINEPVVVVVMVVNVAAIEAMSTEESSCCASQWLRVLNEPDRIAWIASCIIFIIWLGQLTLNGQPPLIILTSNIPPSYLPPPRLHD